MQQTLGSKALSGKAPGQPQQRSSLRSALHSSSGARPGPRGRVQAPHKVDWQAITARIGAPPPREPDAPPLTAAPAAALRPGCCPAGSRKPAPRGPLAVRAEGESQPLEVLRRENELLKKTITSAESAGKRLGSRQPRPGQQAGAGWPGSTRAQAGS